MGKKKLCKLVSDKILDENIEKYIEKVVKPKHICMNCGRVAKNKNNLCKSAKI